MRERLHITIALGLVLTASTLQAQQLDWAKSAGGTGGEVSYAMDIDGAHNIYITGTFNDVADFDPSVSIANLTPVGSNDIFLAKYDSLGNYVWAVSFGGTEYDAGFAIAVDASGNSYITGQFRNTVDFDPSSTSQNLSSSGQSDAFLAKYDTDGNWVWAHRMGGTSFDGGQDLALDGSGNVYVCGDFQNSGTFDPMDLTDVLFTEGLSDGFFAKYNSTGTYQWAKNIGGSNFDAANRIVAEDNGNVYVAGGFIGTADMNGSAIGTNNITSAGTGDIFLVKYNNAGIFVWAKKIGGLASESLTALDLAQNGNVYVGGDFFGNIRFNSTNNDSLTSLGNNDVFFAKYDASGDFVWAKSFGGTQADDLGGISISADNRIYLSGYFRGTVDLDASATNASFTSAGEIDIFLAAYDDSGNHIWSQTMGGTSDDYCEGLAADETGHIYITGYYAGTADFDASSNTTHLTSAGFADVFIARYGASQQTLGLKETENPIRMSLYPNPNMGAFNITFDGMQSDAEVMIYNAIGKLIHQQKITTASCYIQMENQPAGNYFVRITQGENSQVTHIIKQ